MTHILLDGKSCPNIKLIGTHDGTFHCDEALACYLLKTLPRFEGHQISRTRDPKLLEAMDVVVDVGKVFDREALRFDHHQNGFDETFDAASDVKLSSAGLVYKYFGRQIISQILGGSHSEHYVQIIFEKVYNEFVKEIDAIDNGVSQFEGLPGKPRYDIKTNLSRRVSYLNIGWNSAATNETERFERAMSLSGGEFAQCVKSIAEEWLPARQIVEEAATNRLEVDLSGKIMKLAQFCPWKSHLFELRPAGEEILYVIFEGNDDSWRIAAVPVSESAFKSKKALPAAWRGLDRADLDEAAGVPGCTFVHGTGFIGGNKTFEGALEMARRAVRSET